MRRRPPGVLPRPAATLRDPQSGLDVLWSMLAPATDTLATALSISLAGVEKHTQRIFAKLGLAPDDDTAHRRVAAVLHWLRQGS